MSGIYKINGMYSTVFKFFYNFNKSCCSYNFTLIFVAYGVILTKPNVKERYTDFNVYNAEKVQVRAHEVAVDDVETSPVSIITRQDDVLEIVGEYESGVIYNVNGQAVATLRGSPTTSIANIPNGVYVVSLTLTDGSCFNAKFIR